MVISQSDVWVFGQPYVPGAGLGAWHYNGRTWSHVASGHGLEGGSALSANNIWAFDGTDIAHWNGATWSRTSVSYLLPAKHELNDPMITGIFAQSGRSVYAIANGNLQDEGGPIVILHWDGYQWYRVAEGNYGFGDGALQQASSDGHGACSPGARRTRTPTRASISPPSYCLVFPSFAVRSLSARGCGRGGWCGGMAAGG